MNQSNQSNQPINTTPKPLLNVASNQSTLDRQLWKCLISISSHVYHLSQYQFLCGLHCLRNKQYKEAEQYLQKANELIMNEIPDEIDPNDIKLIQIPTQLQIQQTMKTQNKNKNDSDNKMNDIPIILPIITNEQKNQYIESETKLREKLYLHQRANMKYTLAQSIWHGSSNESNRDSAFQQAKTLIIESLELENNTRPELWNELVLLIFDAGQFNYAYSMYEILCELFPNSADLWNNIGVLHLLNKNYNESINCFQRVLNQNKTNVSALNNYGIVLLQQQK